MTNVFDEIIEEYDAETKEKKESVLKLEKYPRKIENKESYTYFPLPRGVMTSDNYYNFSKYEFAVICLLSYYSRFNNDKKCIESPLLFYDMISRSLSGDKHRKRDSDKIKETMVKMSGLTEISIDFVSKESFTFKINSEKGYNKTPNDGVNKILMSDKTANEKTTMLAVFMAINSSMYVGNSKEYSELSFAEMGVISDKTNVSKRTLTRVLPEMEKEKIIAKYYVALGGSKARTKNIIANYNNRDILRRYVEDSLTDKSSRIISIIDDLEQ